MIRDDAHLSTALMAKIPCIFGHCLSQQCSNEDFNNVDMRQAYYGILSAKIKITIRFLAKEFTLSGTENQISEKYKEYNQKMLVWPCYL